jgi:Na+/H+ antiporter NhaA
LILQYKNNRTEMVKHALSPWVSYSLCPLF